MQGRHWPRLSQSEVPEGGGVSLGALVVDLVGNEHDRLPGAAQQLDHRLVVVGRAHGGVDDEHHDIGQVDRDLGLLGDAQVDARGVDLPAASVDEGEPPAGPVRVIGDAVTGHARDVLDHCLPPPQDAVDERRLAYVRAAHHCHDGQRAVLRGIPIGIALPLEQRTVLLGEVELLQPSAQGALDGGVVGQVLAHRRSFITVRWGLRVWYAARPPMRATSPARVGPHCRALFAPGRPPRLRGAAR